MPALGDMKSIHDLDVSQIGEKETQGCYFDIPAIVFN